MMKKNMLILASITLVCAVYAAGGGFHGGGFHGGGFHGGGGAFHFHPSLHSGFNNHNFSTHHQFIDHNNFFRNHSRHYNHVLNNKFISRDFNSSSYRHELGRNNFSRIANKGLSNKLKFENVESAGRANNLKFENVESAGRANKLKFENVESAGRANKLKFQSLENGSNPRRLAYPHNRNYYRHHHNRHWWRHHHHGWWHHPRHGWLYGGDVVSFYGDGRVRDWDNDVVTLDSSTEDNLTDKLGLARQCEEDAKRYKKKAHKARKHNHLGLASAYDNCARVKKMLAEAYRAGSINRVRELKRMFDDALKRVDGLSE